MKRYIDGAGLGRRQLTTRRGIYLRSIIGIVLGEPVLLLLEVVVIEGGRIRARHGYPLSSKGREDRGEARRSFSFKDALPDGRWFVMDLARYRPTASFSERFTCGLRAPRPTGLSCNARAPFSNCPPLTGGRGTKVRVIISRPAFIKSRDASLSIRVRCVELLPLLQLSFANS